MLSATYLGVSAAQVAVFGYLRCQVSEYRKSMLEIESLEPSQRRKHYVMALGSVEGRPVRVALTSLCREIRKLSAEERRAVFKKPKRSVPVYVRTDGANPGFLIQGRSMGCIEADFFEHGYRRANLVFVGTLLLTPVLLIVTRRELRKGRRIAHH
jgi:hypothetical protein